MIFILKERLLRGQNAIAQLLHKSPLPRKKRRRPPGLKQTLQELPMAVHLLRQVLELQHSKTVSSNQTKSYFWSIFPMTPNSPFCKCSFNHLLASKKCVWFLVEQILRLLNLRTSRWLR